MSYRGGSSGGWRRGHFKVRPVAAFLIAEDQIRPKAGAGGQGQEEGGFAITRALCFQIGANAGVGKPNFTGRAGGDRLGL